MQARLQFRTARPSFCALALAGVLAMSPMAAQALATCPNILAIGGIIYSSGTTVYNIPVPDTECQSQIKANTTVTINTGTVQVIVPNLYVLTYPTPSATPGHYSLFAQSHPNNGMQVVTMAPAAVMTGDASGLVLQDTTGAALATRDINIQQGGNIVAIGTYDYSLRSQYVAGASDNGLYVDDLLTRLNLQPGESLTLTENDPLPNPNDPSDTNDMAAQLTGTGNLIVAANDTVALSNTNNTFTGTTEVTSGTLLASAANVIATSSAVTLDASTTFDTGGYDQSLNNLNGDAASNILLSNDDTLTLNGASADAGVISGAGALTVASGTTTLSGADTYTGATTVDGGATLAAGADNTFSASSDDTVASAGTLNLQATDETVGSLTNAGTVNMGTAAPASPGKTLTTSGDYTGSGGTLVMGGALDGVGATDLLHVAGDTSGTTVINYTGSSGAATTGDGILVVQVDGASNGTFTLPGGSLTVDGLKYVLVKGTANPNNWYLQVFVPQSSGAAAPIPALSETALALLAALLGLSAAALNRRGR